MKNFYVYKKPKELEKEAKNFLLKLDSKGKITEEELMWFNSLGKIQNNINCLNDDLDKNL